MNLVTGFAKRTFYRPLPPPRLTGHYDGIVVHCYAGEWRNGHVWLPETEKLSLIEAVHLCHQGYAERIFWANTLGYAIPPRDMDDAKRRVVEHAPNYRTFIRCETKALPVVNTVTEIDKIVETFTDLERLIAIGHWMHMLRAQYAWDELFDGEVAVVSMDATWNGSNHPSPYCRSDDIFLAMNIYADIRTRVLGVDSMRKLTHVKV